MDISSKFSGAADTVRTIPEEPLSHVKGFHEDKLDKIGEVAATFLYLWFSKSGITLLDEQVSST